MRNNIFKERSLTKISIQTDKVSGNYTAKFEASFSRGLDTNR